MNQITEFVRNLFNNTATIQPHEECEHLELLAKVGKEFHGNGKVVVSATPLFSITSDEERAVLQRLHKYGHVVIMHDTNRIALNLFTAADNRTVDAIARLISNPQVELHRPKFCRNLADAQMLDLAWNMYHQKQRVLEQQEQGESPVQFARVKNGKLYITTWKAKNRLPYETYKQVEQNGFMKSVIDSQGWVGQVYRTKEQQISFEFFREEALKWLQYDENGNRLDHDQLPTGIDTPVQFPMKNIWIDGKLHCIKELYECTAIFADPPSPGMFVSVKPSQVDTAVFAEVAK